jgi:hypothetical protein
MNPRKQKEKDRRRARKLADEAWEAVSEGNLDLGEKIIRRAVAAQEDNPVLWNDQGMVLILRKKEAEAAEFFRAALSLSPSYAEPYARLAALRFRQGFVREAVSLQRQAVEHAPDNVLYAEQLLAYQSSLGVESKPKAVESADLRVREDAGRAGELAMTGFESIDWPQVEAQLTRQGCVCMPKMLDAEKCAHLRSMFDDDALFAKTVVMDRPDYGRGTYRYFRAPIPESVDQLRNALYPHAARIANEWQRLLGRPDRYPEIWEDFRAICAQAGQTASTPILLKYTAGGFNALHRDLRGEVFFPIQLAVVLSPKASDDASSEGFRGGEFLLRDVPETRKSLRRDMAAGLGDAILFCTRDRLVSVGGVFGLQPVKHGLSTVESGERYVLGVPFHEYR